jgi:predicted outer membrane repeat protein
VNITSCLFRHNAANFGAAVALRTSATSNIHNCSFAANHASSDGGAIDVQEQRFAKISLTNLSNNTARRGGAVSVSGTARLEFANVSCLENAAMNGGCVSLTTTEVS